MKPQKLMRKPMAKQSGFTLIELMIVVAIIGILAAVAIPNFLAARNRALWVSCLESLAGLKVAEEMFITDVGNYTSDINELAQYMIAGCTDSTGVAGACSSPATLEDRIHCVPGTVVLTMPGSIFNYQIDADAKEPKVCSITVNPAGYTPTAYSACP